MAIKLLNMMRNGSISEILFTQSAITDERMIVVKDDKNKRLWIFNGKRVNPEVKRLAAFTLEELKSETNYEEYVVSDVEWKEKKDYLFHLARDPNYSPNTSTSIVNKTEKKEVKKTPPISSGIGFAPTPPSRATMTPSVVNEYVENKSVPQKVIKEQAESKLRIKETASSISPKSASIPLTPVVEKTSKDLDLQVMPKADTDAGPLIDEFQISYYEQSGGQNFIIIEELSKGISKVHEFTQVKNLIQAINELVDRGATQLTASKVLNKQLDILIKSIFRN